MLNRSTELASSSNTHKRSYQAVRGDLVLFKHYIFARTNHPPVQTPGQSRAHFSSSRKGIVSQILIYPE